MIQCRNRRVTDWSEFEPVYRSPTGTYYLALEPELRLLRHGGLFFLKTVSYYASVCSSHRGENCLAQGPYRFQTGTHE
jgi:hypothetical protein